MSRPYTRSQARKSGTTKQPTTTVPPRTAGGRGKLKLKGGKAKGETGGFRKVLVEIRAHKRPMMVKKSTRPTTHKKKPIKYPIK